MTWIADSYTELQQEHPWRWLRKSFTVNTVADDGEYAFGDCTDTETSAVISRFSAWYPNTFKAYLSSGGVGGEYELHWVPWDTFRRRYRYGTQTSSTPNHVSEDPTRKFVLGPKPNAVFVVSGDFQKGPQTLALDADEPEMPSQFHKVIVYDALIRYGFNRVAPEALQYAQTEGSRLMSALKRDQLPQITLGASLA